ncbi:MULTISPECIES: helix-turn-helix transcriptional regulator [unclassified Bacillus cereus group]|uniref:helix-turn-helix domain-containing protein n=1 Tax=unclassified Bacillus cereus group TaxID=2750818 RepID=UPI0029C2EF01|nr:helix-turn-helix transcriptional regulator [Bacillus cereus group sp. BfR-BA-02730]MDX5808356.1 helix-turn-helix transcriptional regulator [Bacillus cereus group sp. BfR-BA-02730]
MKRRKVEILSFLFYDRNNYEFVKDEYALGVVDVFKKRLRLARKWSGLTQEELAIKVNTKKTTISNYETGYSTPSIEMLDLLCDVLNVSSDFLLGRTDEPSLSSSQVNHINQELLTKIDTAIEILKESKECIPGILPKE